MAKVEIPDDMVPDGYELTGEYRQAQDCEYWMNSGSILGKGRSSCAHPILRKKLSLPATFTLKPGWVAKDTSGSWYWYSTQPTFGGGIWSGEGSVSLNALDVEWPVVQPKDSLIKV
jgi:hypothetical protein